MAAGSTCFMTLSDLDLSRAVSHALRHEPWLYELELDEEGWAPVDQLLAALNEKGGDWERVDRAALERMLASATKRRHELDGHRGPSALRSLAARTRPEGASSASGSAVPRDLAGDLGGGRVGRHTADGAPIRAPVR